MNNKPNIPQNMRTTDGGVIFPKIVSSIGRTGRIISRKNKYISTEELNINCIKPYVLSEIIIH